MKKDLNYYLSLPYTIELIPESNDSWFAGIKELPGCMTVADTREEALSEIDQIKREWLEIALEEGIPIPEPESEENFSGRFNLRVSKSLHQKLVNCSKAEGVSLNTFCATVLAEGVGAFPVKHSKKSGENPQEWAKAIAKITDILESEEKLSLWREWLQAVKKGSEFGFEIPETKVLLEKPVEEYSSKESSSPDHGGDG